MTNVDLQLSTIGVSEILFSNHNTPISNTVSGMLFVSGANLIFVSNGQTKTVTIT